MINIVNGVVGTAMTDNELKRNGSGCYDPTAYAAIKKVSDEKESAKCPEEVEFNKLLRVIFSICELAGYKVEGRITLRDKKTGRVWK